MTNVRRFIFCNCLLIVVSLSLSLYGQSQNQDTHTPDYIRERERSANEKALMRFFKRSLPFTWRFTSTEKSLTLERNAPVYILSHAHNTEILNTKASLLSYAKKKGHPTVCAIRFRLERHDDIAVVRQKVRLYQEIRQNLENTYNRLNLKFLCRYQTITECSLSSGQGKEAALEYLRTKKIVTEKLEPVPLYRIGTFYLYPLKHQCVTPNHDWYFENTMIGADDILLPYEAQEEIQIILKNIDELRFWE